VVTDSFIQQSDTAQNKIQSFAFCLALSTAACLSICFVVSSLAGFGQPCEIRLESRINPNYAPPASLVRLPGIGDGRARAIVAYRDEFSKKDSNSIAFRNCADLQKVKGIGPKTVEDMCEWLKFE
jgi:competence ComEA-like helix-hairpin-helix protein